MTIKKKYIIPLHQIKLQDVAQVGGKNASLGEMILSLSKENVKVPGGFATTAQAYWDFLEENKIKNSLSAILSKLDRSKYGNLNEVSQQARDLILQAKFSNEFSHLLKDAYESYCKQNKISGEMAVRSSATAEDLPEASFAGQQETFLNVKGAEAIISACQRCFASLFTARAIKYREDHGFDHMKVALSVGIQEMIRSDKSCSGVMFTLEPETGFREVVVINGLWGLGENLVQGEVDPDEFIVFKPSLEKSAYSILSKKLGQKHQTMIYSKSDKQEKTTLNIDTPLKKQKAFILTDDEVEQLAKWAVIIEKHYKTPMDIEWAKDGNNQELYIVQARPETVHAAKDEPYLIHTYQLKSKGDLLASGIGLGNKIAKGKARILKNPSEGSQLKEGEVLVTDITNPDWDPLMKKAAAIVTNKGGRTSHAAIVARELGAVAVVGTGNATEKIKNGQEVTVSCAEGKKGVIYNGLLDWDTTVIDTRNIKLPHTQSMLILADPDKAFKYSFLPNQGVGLLRMEFIINNSIEIHPLALINYKNLKDKEAKSEIKKRIEGYSKPQDYFIDQLAQAVSTVAAAFYPKDVIVRMSDFKSNEYANLIGGKAFEPKEENPMLGFRGAARYYNELYREGFKLECEAMKKVRNQMGLTNVKLMIPFCRTVEEGKKVIEIMAQSGLKQGENGLEIYSMIEIPSNVILADQFADIFDGFSIGSNDLTQLTLGLDRDSTLVQSLFDERNEAVQRLIQQVIEVAKKKGIKIGLCGQAPSDFPEFAEFLVKAGINSISFNPDALVQGIKNIKKAEDGLS